STEINNQSDEISLKELIQKIGEWYRYLKTQWWKIVIAGIIGGVIGFVYAWMQPITYTAKTTFVVEDAKSSGGGLNGLASLAGQFGVDVG
ncbi:Wzz/FepE/Etk N-terminal domain-containing protein, partial [Shewanella algae]|uniref:Wzz/FepE/Etk N-terminal domain-containing protein n=1 Tax=Shewanella algae TaxID=38313 RepID=UPI00313ED423